LHSWHKGNIGTEKMKYRTKREIFTGFLCTLELGKKKREREKVTFWGGIKVAAKNRKRARKRRGGMGGKNRMLFCDGNALRSGRTPKKLAAKEDGWSKKSKFKGGSKERG